MDQHEKTSEEQQVEDLELPKDATDDVRGGASPQIGPQVRAQRFEAGQFRYVDGGMVQHNETLIRV